MLKAHYPISHSAGLFKQAVKLKGLVISNYLKLPQGFAAVDRRVFSFLQELIDKYVVKKFSFKGSNIGGLMLGMSLFPSAENTWFREDKWEDVYKRL